ncbi:MAG: hypothetical protein U5J62_02255 [Desulfurivibrio sp.]|nr:hypothetical protein [Desulfurivibrio sp.]
MKKCENQEFSVVWCYLYLLVYSWFWVICLPKDLQMIWIKQPMFCCHLLYMKSLYLRAHVLEGTSEAIVLQGTSEQAASLEANSAHTGRDIGNDQKKC